MKQCFLVLMVVFITLGINVQGQETVPLKLVQTITLPATVKGHFDHFEVDLKGGRLFATPEGYKSVLVFDLETGKLIHTIGGIGKSHAVLYREDLNRIYVTDGEVGDVKIFDGKTYRLLSSVKLLEDADSIGYDPATKYLYVDNGGGDVHQTYSMISVVDTTAGKKLADIKVDGDTLEAMALETSSPKTNVAIGLDEADHRLFVACRDGQISVVDTQTGREITTLPITKGVDDLKYDISSKRIYSAGDGNVDVYEQTDRDNYKKLGAVPTGPLGKTARLVPELNKYFVAVPQHETESAKILVFEVH